MASWFTRPGGQPRYSAPPASITPAYVALSGPTGRLVVPPIAWPRIALPPPAKASPAPTPEVVAAGEPEAITSQSTPPAVDASVAGSAPDPALMAAAEARYGLPTGILHAIAILESGDGRQACGHNPFGIASCGIDFPTWTAAIDYAARLLSGPPYAGHTTREKLCIWESGQPCTIAAGSAYADRGLALMP